MAFSDHHLNIMCAFTKGLKYSAGIRRYNHPTNNLKDWNACLGIKSRENLRYIEYNQNGSKLDFENTSDYITLIKIIHELKIHPLKIHPLSSRSFY